MLETEFPVSRPDDQPELAAEKSEAARDTQEEMGQLNREVCLGNLVDTLDIDCTPEEKAKLIPLMIEAEAALPKTFDQLPVKIAKMKIVKQLLPKAIDSAHDEALAEEQAKREEDKTTKIVLSEKNENLTSLKTEQEQLQKEGKSGLALLQALQNTDIAQQNEAIQKMLADFSKIISLAQTPEDQAIIEASISKQDFARLPNPEWFVQLEVYGNDNVSEATKAEIEQVMKIPRLPKQHIETGTDVQDAARLMTIDPDTGESVPAHTEDCPAEIVEGVSTYTRTGKEVFLKAQVGDRIHRVDVTGWSALQVGLYAEALGFWAGTEKFGATSFVEDIYKIDFSFFEEDVLDPLKLIEIRQKLSYLVGGFEGYDGDIFNPEEKKGLIRAQMRALNPSGTAYGWEADREQTQIVTRQFGLDNPVVLQAFGDYTQRHYLSGEITFSLVHDYLYHRFPDLVQKPKQSHE